MAVGSGLHTVFGCAEEVTYGTVVAPDRFYEITSETLDRRNRTINSNGLRSGARNLKRGSRRVLSARDGGGDVNFEVATTGFGRLFKHMLGGTPSVVQQGGTAAYLHTYQMGSLPTGLTLQKQIRDANDTAVQQFTFHGSKVLSWEFGISVDQLLLLKLTFDSEDVDTSTGAAAASYGTTKLFNFKQGVLKVAGSSVAAVTNASVAGSNNLKTDRFYLGSAGVKAEPIDSDFPTVSGSLAAEFSSAATFYDRFAADSAAALVLEFDGDNIASTYDEILRITVPEVRFTGEAPKVSGPDVVVQNVPFEGLYDGSNAGVKIEYQTTDTAV